MGLREVPSSDRDGRQRIGQGPQDGGHHRPAHQTGGRLLCARGRHGPGVLRQE